MITMLIFEASLISLSVFVLTAQAQQYQQVQYLTSEPLTAVANNVYPVLTWNQQQQQSPSAPAPIAGQPYGNNAAQQAGSQRWNPAGTQTQTDNSGRVFSWNQVQTEAAGIIVPKVPSSQQQQQQQQQQQHQPQQQQQYYLVNRPSTADSPANDAGETIDTQRYTYVPAQRASTLLYRFQMAPAQQQQQQQPQFVQQPIEYIKYFPAQQDFAVQQPQQQQYVQPIPQQPQQPQQQQYMQRIPIRIIGTAQLPPAPAPSPSRRTAPQIVLVPARNVNTYSSDGHVQPMLMQPQNSQPYRIL